MITVQIINHLTGTPVRGFATYTEAADYRRDVLQGTASEFGIRGVAPR